MNSTEQIEMHWSAVTEYRTQPLLYVKVNGNPEIVIMLQIK